MDRYNDLERFYNILNILEQRLGGKRQLLSCSGKMKWPERGVYFFFESNETRVASGNLRVVRVGTHALKDGAKSTLRDRLKTHRGTSSGGGNHRGSVFRLHVGSALLAGGDYSEQIKKTWGKGASAPQEIRLAEKELERRVSEYIGGMYFLWLKVDDPPGPDSLRGYIERNSIALLSNAGKTSTDPSFATLVRPLLPSFGYPSIRPVEC